MSITKSSSFFSNSFSIFITRFFPSLANLVVLILYSRQLPQDVYGYYQHFWIQLFVIYPFMCFGIHVLAVTYQRDFIISLLRSIQARYYGFYALWVAILGGIFALLQVNTLHIAFAIPFLFIVSYSLSLILESYLIVTKYFGSLVIINVIYSAFYCFIHWHVLQTGFSMQEVFAHLLILTLIRLSVYCGLAASNARTSGKLELPGSNTQLTSIRNLWLHLGVYDILQVLFSWIDKFIMSLVLTAGLSAIYFNGAQTIPFLPLLIGAAGSAVLMQLAAGSKKNEVADTIVLMNHTGRVLSSIVFPVFFFLIFFRQELFHILFLDKYNEAIPVFLVSLLVLPLRAYSFTTVLQRWHKGNIINAGAIADIILACALIYPLYRWMGLPGVALSFVISTYLQASFYLIYSARLLKTSPLNLVPYINWLVKLIVYSSLFIIIRYAGERHFTAKFTLILGAALMAVMVIVSLLVEFLKIKRYGRHA